MKTKDVVRIALLSIVGFGLSLVGSLATPLLGNYSFAGEVAFGAFLGGAVYYVLTQKVPRRGTSFSYFTIMGSLYLIMGFWTMAIILAIAGFLGELCLIPVGAYKNRWRITGAYVLSNVVYALHPVFIFYIIGVDRLLLMFPNAYTVDGAHTLQHMLYSPLAIISIIGICLICAFFGMAIGHSVYEKFFHGGESVKREPILK